MVVISQEFFFSKRPCVWNHFHWKMIELMSKLNFECEAILYKFLDRKTADINQGKTL